MNFLSVLELIKNGDYQNAKTLLFEILDKGEISNEEIDMLEKYYMKNKNNYVGYVFFKALVKKHRYFEAYDMYINLLKDCPIKREFSFKEVIQDAPLDQMELMYKDIILRLQIDIDIPQSLIVSEIVDVIVPELWSTRDEKKYEMIANLASLIWFEDLKNSNYIYELAVSCEKVDNELAEKLYLKLIQKEPANTEALNNIGLMYERKTQYDKAKFYFSKAYMFCDTNKTYRKNLERVSSKK